MEKILTVLVLVFIVYVLVNARIPAGYHVENTDGSYTPVQNSLWESFIRSTGK